MEESNRHEAMKNHVASELEAAGFETEQEVPVPTDVKYHHHDYLVDVLAERNGDEIAIEIGQLKQREIDDIEQHVDRVIHIPYQSAKQAGVDSDLYRVAMKCVQFSDEHDSMKQFVSQAVMEQMGKFDESHLGMALRVNGYDSLEELEAVVQQEQIPVTVLERIDETLDSIR